MHIGINLFIINLSVLLADNIFLEFHSDLLNPVSNLLRLPIIHTNTVITKIHRFHHKGIVTTLNLSGNLQKFILILLNLLIYLINEPAVFFHLATSFGITGSLCIVHIINDILHQRSLDAL